MEQVKGYEYFLKGLYRMQSSIFSCLQVMYGYIPSPEELTQAQMCSMHSAIHTHGEADDLVVTRSLSLLHWFHERPGILVTL
jgi:hypothetical protein